MTAGRIGLARPPAIYYRYFHRQTRSPAFRSYWVAVTYLHWRCRRAMRGGR